MITKINIKGFKNLNDATIEFYTSKNIADKNKEVTRKHELINSNFTYTFNLAGIIGANATGKSSFLDAILIYKKILMNNFEMFKSDFQLLYGCEKNNKEFIFEYLIDKKILKHHLILNEKFEILSEELFILESSFSKNQWRTIFNNDKKYSLLWRVSEISKYEKITNNSFSFSLQEIQLILAIFNTVQTIVKFDNTLGPNEYNYYLYMLKDELNYIFKNPNLKDSKKRLSLLKSLITAVDPNIIDFKFDYAKKDIFVIVKNNQKLIEIPFETISEGTKRFICLMRPIFFKKNTSNFYLIDEIENSFHPKIIDTILRLFYFNQNNINNSQLLFTTHNPYIFDLATIHNSCINISLYSHKKNFEKLISRNDKLFSKNYMLEIINSHPDGNSINDIYDNFIDQTNNYGNY